MNDWLSVHRGEAPLVVAFPHVGSGLADVGDRFVSPWLARRDAERLQPIDQRLRWVGDVEARHRHAVDHHGGATARRRGDGNALAGWRRTPWA